MSLLLTTGSQLHCAHGGRAIADAHSTRVFVSGAPALIMRGPMAVAGCPLVGTGGGGGQPTGGQHTVVAGFCLQAIPTSSAVRVTAQGFPLLLQTSALIGVPSGAPLVLGGPAQVRVSAT